MNTYQTALNNTQKPIQDSNVNQNSLNTQNPNTHTVFLVGLSSDFTSDSLKNHFIYNLKYISVIEVNMPKVNRGAHRNTKQKFLGCGTMTLTDKRELQSLLKVGSFKFKGRKFFIKPYLVGEELAKFKEKIHKRRIFVHNIPKGVTNEELGEIFSCFGEVEDSYLIRSNKSKKYKASPQKYGYVIFKEEVDASTAIFASRVIYKSHKLLIKPFSKKEKKGRHSKIHPIAKLNFGSYTHLKQTKKLPPTQDSFRFQQSAEYDSSQNPLSPMTITGAKFSSVCRKVRQKDTMMEILEVSQRISSLFLPGNYRFNRST